MNRSITYLLLLIALMCSVSALELTSPTLGDSTTLKDTQVSTTFKLKNDGNYTVSDIIISTTADDKYDVIFQNIPETLTPGEAKNVKIKAKTTDFEPGKRSIGTIVVTANETVPAGSNPFDSHDFQNPQSTSLPVAMSARADTGCGQSTANPPMPIIGQWHVGTCDSVAEIDVRYPSSGLVDAGWVRIHSDEPQNYWVKPVEYDENKQATSPPKWLGLWW